jgi:hypothetical protein
VEERLKPLNALLGLATPNDVNPAALAAAGFRLVGLEVPVSGSEGTVVVDVVLLHDDSLHLLLCEVKSGANADEGQAQRYAGLAPVDVVRAGHVNIPRRDTLTTEITYVCLGSQVPRVEIGLKAAGVQSSIIAVHDGQVILENEEAATNLVRSVFSAGPILLNAPPLRIIPFDPQSPSEAIRPFVKAQLISALAERLPQITAPTLTERITPYLGLYGRAAANRLIQRVCEAARVIAAEDPTTFAVDRQPRTVLP